MPIKLRKIRLEFVRNTSHVISCLRYDVPVLRSRYPGTEVVIHTIPFLTPGDVVEFENAREAYEEFCGRFGPEGLQTYHDLASFEKEFVACTKRDGVTKKDLEQEAVNPESERKVAMEAMQKIEGVSEQLAASLYEMGFTSIESVAASTLDALEVVAGITPSSSVDILSSAKSVLASLNPEPLVH